MDSETAEPAVAGSLFLVLLVSSILVSFFLGQSQKFNISDINGSNVLGASTINSQDGFKITEVTLGIDSHNKSGCLYKVFNFYGQITSNGKGAISYGWEGSNNSTMTPILLGFDRAETKYVSTDWQVYGPGTRTMKLHVYSPNNISSDEIPFEVVCK